MKQIFEIYDKKTGEIVLKTKSEMKKINLKKFKILTIITF